MTTKKYTSLDEVPEELRAQLAAVFSHPGGSTFAIHGAHPEIIGAGLARYSRAKTGMQLTFLNEFLEDDGKPSDARGTEVLNRVVNQFGDDSVAELATTTIGIEGSSQLQTKQIEDLRLASYIEQSTRYVAYDEPEPPKLTPAEAADLQRATTRSAGRWRYVRPKEIAESGLLGLYERTNDRAFTVYADFVKRLTPHFQQQLPRDQYAIEVERDGRKVLAHEHELTTDDERRAFRNAYGFTIRCAALDVGRCVLPSSTETHLGVVANGRTLTYLITILKSHELDEMRQRGFAIEEAVNTIMPTFIKRNVVDPSHTERNVRMRALAHDLFHGVKPEESYVTLTTANSSADLEKHVLAYSLFPYTNLSFGQLLSAVDGFSQERREAIHDAYLGERKDRRDHVERGLEAMYPFTFDLTGGFAEYRDLHRHRMLTQQRQMLTPDLGFIVPPEADVVGITSDVEEVVGMFEHLNSGLRHAGLEVAAQYATLFNNRIRWVMGMNLRELQHLTELRTQPAGHFSYRAMTQEMARQAITAEPWAAQYLQYVNWSDPGNKISRAREQSRIAGKNLASGIDGSIDA